MKRKGLSISMEVVIIIIVGMAIVLILGGLLQQRLGLFTGFGVNNTNLSIQIFG